MHCRVTAALEAQRANAATRVDFAAANRASPAECNEKTRWPALNPTRFLIRGWMLRGDAKSSDWTPPRKCVPVSMVFSPFFFYGAEIAGRIDTCRKNCCRALESLRENIVIANLFPRFSFSSKNKHRSKRCVCMCMYIYICKWKRFIRYNVNK